MNHYVQTLKAHLFLLQSELRHVRGYVLHTDLKIKSNILAKQIKDIREEIKRIEEGE